MNYAAARRNMVENQIRPNRVTDPALTEAMEALPRELFVPKQLRGIAYVDEDIDLGAGRYLLEPLVLARLLQMAQVRPTDIVLDIGCATGYSSGVIAKLSSAVVALESDPELAARAAALLRELGTDNVAVVTGPLDQGYPAQAPYDVILFGGAVMDVPQAICKQLADGGRMVAVVYDGAGIGKGTLIRRDGDAFSRVVMFDAGTPLLPGFVREPGFVF